MGFKPNERNLSMKWLFGRLHAQSALPPKADMRSALAHVRYGQ
jgi:hypothetical protein